MKDVCIPLSVFRLTVTNPSSTPCLFLLSRPTTRWGEREISVVLAAYIHFMCTVQNKMFTLQKTQSENDETKPKFLLILKCAHKSLIII